MGPNKNKFPNCARGYQYAQDIIAGKIVSCVYVKGSCERFFRDLENTAANFYMDWEKAEHFLVAVQRFNHIKGQWKTENIYLEPWQCFIFMNVFGFRNKETKFRRFRVCHAEVARGNGKSAMASSTGLYCLSLDNPKGNEISCLATKKDQAKIVLDSARAMAKGNSSFINGTKTKVLKHSIEHRASNSIMKAQSNEDSTLDGLNDVLAILDELHAMKQATYDVILSGMSKRKDSLALCITTAGNDISSVGHSQSNFAKKVCLGEVVDDTFFAIVYTLDEDDDWEDERNWIKANPNLDISVDRDSLRSKMLKARETPADAPNFKIKHLNLWIGEAKAFFDLQAWDKCFDPKICLEDFTRAPCRLGLDLAQHIDLTSIGIVFKRDGIYYIFDKTYYPEESIRRERNTLFLESVAQGYLIQTKGAVINYDFIADELRALKKNHNIQECLYDPYSAQQLAQTLSNEMEMVKVALNVGNISEPMKALDAAIREGKVKHNGSPLLRWCLGNVVAKEDANSNVYPRKSHVRLKIDPVFAIILAMASHLADRDSTESVYNERGLRSL